MLLIITSLLFAGCSNGTKTSTDGKAGTNNATSTTGASTISKDAKTINDSDLMNSATSDSTVQLDSVDDPTQQLSSDEIDALLNDKTISSNDCCITLKRNSRKIFGTKPCDPFKRTRNKSKKNR
jgi:hypothetical protein